MSKIKGNWGKTQRQIRAAKRIMPELDKLFVKMKKLKEERKHFHPNDAERGEIQQEIDAINKQIEELNKSMPIIPRFPELSRYNPFDVNLEYHKES